MYYNRKFINILYVITTFKKDGPGNVLLNILKNIDRKQFNPIVVCMYKGGKLEEDIRHLNIKTFNLNMISPFNGWLDFRAIVKLGRLIKQYDVDIIHAHLVRATVYGGFASLFFRKPLMVTVHNMEEHQSKGGLFISLVRKFDRYILSQLKIVVCVSKQVKKHLLKYYKLKENKIFVIHNGIDISKYFTQKQNGKLRKEFNISLNTILVGTVARLHKQKGIKYLIEAAEKVLKKYKKIKFIIVGDGEIKEDLLKIISIKNLGKYIIFAGFRTDIKDILADFDIFVLPSLWEGLPNALLEAMATGLPCIATNVSGNAEVINNDVTGVLIPSKDAEMLSKAIEKLIVSGKEYRKKLGYQGQRSILKNFNAKKMTLEYEQYYAKLLE